MIKKSFLNPGAYIIFIKALKNEETTWKDIGEIMGTSGAYPQSVVQGKANPKYSMVEKADVGFKAHFLTNDEFKRHLRKTVEVYPTEDCVDWLDHHPDFDLLIHELGYTKSTFNNQVMSKLMDKSIKFLAVSELTWIIDEWENTSLGDFNLSNKTFYSVIKKGVSHGVN
tara:strand:+ start:4279 stop:4785 length:507 start_codon:yes stop_codon:yes gene_type:complete